VVPGTQKPAPDQLEQFDPSHTTVCLPLGPGQMPVHETWELIQLSTENHNFHIHQTRFVMTGSNGGVMQDNFPLGVAAPPIADQVANNQNGVCSRRAVAIVRRPPRSSTSRSRSLGNSSTTAISSNTRMGA
jgi:L-ascorbate oxidase